MTAKELQEAKASKDYTDFIYKIQKAKKDGVYTITASTPDMDRDGEIILPSAFKASLPAYLEKNPIILWMHDMWSPPIARTVDARVGETFEIDITFASTPFAQEIKTLVDEGMLNTSSIGGMIKDWEYNSDGVKVILDLELWEVSIVTIPSNRSAVINRAKVAGLNNVYKLLSDDTVESKSSKDEVDEESKNLKRQKDRALKLADINGGYFYD